MITSTGWNILHNKRSYIYNIYIYIINAIVHSVAIKFPNWGHKKPQKKIKIFVNTFTQYSPRPLPHNVYVAHTTNRMPKKIIFSVSPSVLSSQSVESMKQPRILSIFNLGIKKSQPVLNQRCKLDWIIRGSLVLPKTWRHRPKNAPVHVVQKIPGPTLTNILRTASVSIPVISSNIRTLN
jgi:hypothetical protein